MILLSGLTSCGYPLEAQPLFRGALEGHFYEESYNAYYDPSVEGPPVQADAIVREWRGDGYTFEGTFLWEGKDYSMSGFEEANPNLRYVRLQANLISGFVQIRLQRNGALAYLLCGESRYGVGGGFTPEREKPVAVLDIYLPEKGQCFSELYVEPVGYLRLE